MSEADIVPGLKFRGLYSVLYHVVGVLDDYGVLVVVLRTWRKNLNPTTRTCWRSRSRKRS